MTLTLVRGYPFPGGHKLANLKPNHPYRVVDVHGTYMAIDDGTKEHLWLSQTLMRKYMRADL